MILKGTHLCSVFRPLRLKRLIHGRALVQGYQSLLDSARSIRVSGSGQLC